VFFDVPLEALDIEERLKVRMARAVSKAPVPTAALCYVWDNTHAPGHTAWSAYSERVRLIVLQRGGSAVGRWVTESRDVATDFRAAFGTAAPAITGIAVGADTDQTGERVVAHFGDLSFGLKP
jgi:hypothetical protein